MKCLRIDDIHLQYRDIAEFMQIDKFIEFCKLFGGSYMYIPNSKSLEAIIRDKDIIEMNKKGINIKLIAKKYNVTENYIRKIIKKAKD